MSQRHVAGSGARAGQWVTCNAKGTCRLGGSHISERDFYATRAWVQEETGNNTTNSSVTSDDVKRFQAATAGDTEGYKEWQKKAEILAVKEKGLKNTPDTPVFAGEKNLVNHAPAEAKKFVPYSSSPSIAAVKSKEAKDYVRTGNIDGLVELRNQGVYNVDIANNLGNERVEYIRTTSMEKLQFTSKITGKTLSGYKIPEVQKYMETGDREHLYAADKEYGLTAFGMDKISNKRRIQMKQGSDAEPPYEGTESDHYFYEIARSTPEAKDYIANGNTDSLNKLKANSKLQTELKAIGEMEKVRNYRMSHNPLKEVRFTDPETNQSASTFDIPEVKEYMETGKNTTLVSMQKKYGMSKVFAVRLKNHRAETVGKKPALSRPERPVKPTATTATKLTKPTRPGNLRRVFRKASEFLGNDIKA